MKHRKHGARLLGLLAVAALLYWLWGFWCLAVPVVIGAAAAVMRLDEQKQHKDPKR